MNHGKKLKEIRESRGLVLKNVSDATRIGLSTLSDYENSKCDPSLRNLYILLDFYNINPMYFIKKGEEWVNITHCTDVEKQKIYSILLSSKGK